MEGKIIALMWASKHMEEVISGCQYLKQIPDVSDELMHCIFTGIVISYTRSFTQNNGVSSLDGNFKEFSEDQFRHTHKVLWNARNMIYAHKDIQNDSQVFDDSPEQGEINEVLLKVDGDGFGSYSISRSSLPKEAIEHIEALAKFQCKRINHALAKMITHYVKTNDLEVGEHILKMNDKE